MTKEKCYYCNVCRDRSHWLTLEVWNGDVAFTINHPITFFERLGIIWRAIGDYWRPQYWDLLADTVRVAFTQEDYGEGVSLKDKDLRKILAEFLRGGLEKKKNG